MVLMRVYIEKSEAENGICEYCYLLSLLLSCFMPLLS